LRGSTSVRRRCTYLSRSRGSGFPAPAGLRGRFQHWRRPFHWALRPGIRCDNAPLSRVMGGRLNQRSKRRKRRIWLDLLCQTGTLGPSPALPCPPRPSRDARSPCPGVERDEHGGQCRICIARLGGRESPSGARAARERGLFQRAREVGIQQVRLCGTTQRIQATYLAQYAGGIFTDRLKPSESAQPVLSRRRNGWTSLVILADRRPAGLVIVADQPVCDSELMTRPPSSCGRPPFVTFADRRSSRADVSVADHRLRSVGKNRLFFS